MPPRKRQRVSAASTPLTESQPKTPAESRPKTPASAPRASEERRPADDVLNDPWTDEQETTLFKSLIRWKPTGMHKHFHMLAIAMALRSHGHVTPATPHTRVPGIWAKLDALYDLPSLDLRENSFAFDGLPDPANRDDWDRLPEFRLPGMGGLVPGGGGGSGVRSGAKGGGGKAATTNATTAADDGNNDGDAGQEDNAQAFADLIWARRFPDGSPGEDSDASEGSSPVAEELVSRKGDPPPVPLGEVGEEIMKREGTADTNEDEAGTGTGTGKSTPASSVKGRAAGRARGGRRRR